MKSLRFILTAMLCASPAWAADTGQVRFVLDVAPELSQMRTPAKTVSLQPAVQSQTTAAEIKIAGKTVPILFDEGNGFKVLGIDSNDNGKVDNEEMIRVGGDGTISLKMKSPSDAKNDLAIHFWKVTISRDANNAVARVSARYSPAYCYKGTINETTVRLIDDNLDGKITQDGADAIIIGQNLYAMPLLKTHLIGQLPAELTVAEDGLSVSYVKSDLKLAQVEAPVLKMPSLMCVIMSDKASGRSVDLVAAKGKVPAGEYQFVYGIIGSGKEPIIIQPGKATPSYSIQDDAINTLRLGPPLRLDFEAKLEGNAVTANPPLNVEGSGHEVYHYSSGLAQPQVIIAEGKKVLDRGSMEFG